MKRFLAWVVMAVIEIVVMNLAVIVLRLVLRGVAAITNLSEALFWIIIFLGGGGIIIGAIFGMIGMSGLAVSASEGICPSRRGTRYTAFGAIFVALYVVGLIAGFITHVGGVAIAEMIVCLLCVVVFLFTAHSATT